MASYTIDIRHICELYGREEVEKWFQDYNINDYLSPYQIDTINKLGIWNKQKLAQKIIDHYFMREIGFETPFLFKHYAKIYMKEIMEEYLPIIYSNSIEFDPLVNVDFTETFEREIEGKNNNNTNLTNQETSSNEGTITSSSNNEGISNSHSTNSSSGLNVASDTPQGQINKQSILNGAYASKTNASETSSSIVDDTTTTNTTTSSSNSNNTINTNNTSNSNSNSNSNTLEKYTRKQKGNSGISTTAQVLIEQYRNMIRAVDKEIIEKLNILFMGLY